MNTMKQIVVAVSLVVISATAPTVEAQQVVEKVAPGTLVAPADALNAMLNSTKSQMISLVKAMPTDKYGFAPSGLIFVPAQHTEYTGVRTFGALVSRRSPSLPTSTDRNMPPRCCVELDVLSTSLPSLMFQ